MSQFSFTYPTESVGNDVIQDKDGDIVVNRKKKAIIEIGTIAFVIHFQLIISFFNLEHHNSTDLTLVGLQVWRGALLLADYIFYKQKEFQHKNVIEVGSGVGLTGIAAAIYAKQVICTGI